MLYNPDWDKIVREFDRKEFVSWLGKQPADQTYKYVEGNNCAVGQYLESKGYVEWSNPALEKRLGVLSIVISHPHTFGAAYKRAKGFKGMFGRLLDRWLP